jgi:hypothetical protein
VGELNPIPADLFPHGREIVLQLSLKTTLMSQSLPLTFIIIADVIPKYKMAKYTKMSGVFCIMCCSPPGDTFDLAL